MSSECKTEKFGKTIFKNVHGKYGTYISMYEIGY